MTEAIALLTGLRAPGARRLWGDSPDGLVWAIGARDAAALDRARREPRHPAEGDRPHGRRRHGDGAGRGARIRPSRDPIAQLVRRDPRTPVHRPILGGDYGVWTGWDAESGCRRWCWRIVLISGLVGSVAVVAVYRADGAAPAPFARRATSTPSPAEVAPAACFAFEGGDLGIASGGEALAQAAESAALPTFVALSPGIQVLPSDTTPGTYDLIARVCGGSLSSSELIAAGIAIAAAIYADPARDRLSVLVVAPWTAIGSDAIIADPSGVAISTDYQAHRWDLPPAELQIRVGLLVAAVAAMAAEKVRRGVQGDLRRREPGSLDRHGDLTRPGRAHDRERATVIRRDARPRERLFGARTTRPQPGEHAGAVDGHA